LEYHLTSPESQIAPKNFTDISQLPPHGALTQLGDKFNLSPFELRILLLCVAVELDPIVGQLCADFHGNTELQYPTPFIAYNIFPDATWSAFNPSSPLIKWKLIELKTDNFLPIVLLSSTPLPYYISLAIPPKIQNYKALSNQLISTQTSNSSPLPPNNCCANNRN
jgi:hypothetical protein